MSERHSAGQVIQQPVCGYCNTPIVGGAIHVVEYGLWFCNQDHNDYYDDGYYDDGEYEHPGKLTVQCFILEQVDCGDS